MVESEKAPSRFWKTYRAGFLGAVTVIGVFAGAIWVVWQMSSSYHRAEIESLRQTLSIVTDTYKVLARKTDGLFEPRLLVEDTVETRKYRIFWVLGERMEFYVFPDDNRFRVSYVPFGKVKSIDLTLRPGERHDFEFEQRPYYVVFNYLGDGDSLIRAQLYELKPLYKPAGR